MIPGCTSTLELEIDGYDLNLVTVKNIYVTIVQGIRRIVKTGDDLTVTTTVSEDNPPVDVTHISVGFTQAETLRLLNNTSAEVQVNWLYEDLSGNIQRKATEAETLDIGKQLLPRVLP